VSLVAYGRTGPAGFKATGGILTITTALQLSAAEADMVSKALTKYLARLYPPAEGEPPLRPELRPIDWVKGSVDLQVVAGVTATGTPSLFGGNQFSFSANLDAATIATVLEAWEHGLPNASITYHLTARTRQGRITTATHTMNYEATAVDGEAATRRTVDVTGMFRDAAGPAPDQDLQFTGPLLPRGSDPQQFVKLQSF
jgi:hypothetical protein